MKITFENLIDQKKLLSHVFFLIITIFIVVFVSLRQRTELTPKGVLSFLALGFVQFEIFIFIAHLIFRKLNAGIAGKELTRIVLSRFFIFIVICFFAAFVIILFFRFTIEWISGGNLSAVLQNFMKYEFKSWFKSTLGGLSFGAVIFIVIQWQDALKREQKLREENLVFQNETLKSQVNPHFLFNSLNTVSSLIQSHPEKAELFINNLSSVYRYILENGQKDKVTLKSELDLINKYFDLHRVRDAGKVCLTIDCPHADDCYILPVSLQILVENAIKHNSSTRDKPLQISIFCEDQYVLVRNNIQKMASQLKSTGIGLKNLAERIRLISGKTIIIEEQNDYFTVKVPLLK